MPALLVCLLCIIVLPVGLIGQADVENQLSTTATKELEQLFKDFDHLQTPGYAVGISKGGKILYTNGFGAANLDYEIPISANSAFSIASVSKQFTAACIGLLILDEKLDLETAVADILPALAKYEETIRIKHLIYNTSGLTDYYQQDRAGDKSWITFNYFDIDECIETALAVDTLQFKPGTRWAYNNVNFMLLTKIVEKISGQRFSVFAKERLFDPLGMTSTLINDDATTIIKKRVTPYNFRTKEAIEGYGEYGVEISAEGEFIRHPRISPHYGGSGVVTTINDLLKWCKNMISKDFGGKAFYKLMHQTPSFEHGRNNQAFGLYHGDHNGIKMVAWDGGDWGISSQMIRFPKSEVAIIVLSNIGTGESFRKAYAIADILMEEGILK